MSRSFYLGLGVPGFSILGFQGSSLLDCIKSSISKAGTFYILCIPRNGQSGKDLFIERDTIKKNSHSKRRELERD